ncbi:MAG: segregation/condensation protein A [Bacilli bacterium]|nr:segregation/condensation protein A [Bacilli bacterium]
MIQKFTVNDFEGPLDLLLHLIRSSKMDIYNINVESITKQYIDFINESKDMSIDLLSEYLVMASELLHLKSKLLLGKTDEPEDEEYEINSTEDLQEKLLEYESMKEVANKFKDLEDKRSVFFTKLPSDLSEYMSDKPLSSDVSIDDLTNALKVFLEREELNKPLNTKITKRELSVTERSKEIRETLKKLKKCEFTSLFEDTSKPYVIITFLSILEMSKNKELTITQDKIYGSIYLEMK